MPGDRAIVALFARAPRAGLAKTRLVPALGEEGAAALYRAFVTDTVERVRGIDGLEPILWAASEDDRAELARAFPDVPLAVQPEGDLGARMAAALTDGVRRAGRAMVLGTDAPTLPSRCIVRALALLEHSDVVLGPAADGGYYLIASRAPRLTLSARWSSKHALADTVACLRAAGHSVARGAPWYDVDCPADLALLAAHLALRPDAAKATAAALRDLVSFDRRSALQ